MQGSVKGSEQGLLVERDRKMVVMNDTPKLCQWFHGTSASMPETLAPPGPEKEKVCAPFEGVQTAHAAVLEAERCFSACKRHHL
jgi:hypothetical protein